MVVMVVVEAAADEGRAAEGLLLEGAESGQFGERMYTPRFRPILWPREEAT